MHLSDFDYDLPEALIAQTPVEPRDSSRLLVLNRAAGTIEHRTFHDIGDYLNAGDVLVINVTRVLAARLYAVKVETQGAVELLLLKQHDPVTWSALVGGRRCGVGTRLRLRDVDIHIEVVAEAAGSERLLRFDQPLDDILAQIGTTPLPPYIRQGVADSERYQTIYSRVEGSAAAPTAGLHFTPDLLIALRRRGIQIAECTLHIGLDTFQPVKTETITEHTMHSEYARLSADDARLINEAKLAGKRVIAIGTTSARTLETAGILSEGGDPADAYAEHAACPWRPVTAFERPTTLFIRPGYRWRVLDGLVTNFHLPKSTLLMMVSALAGREAILDAYETAKREGYRFFSFGDAMFIL